MNAFKKRIRSSKLYKEFINIFNGVLQLSVRETEVLALLLKLDTEWNEDEDGLKNVISRTCRKYIIKEAIISKSNLSKFIKKYKEIGLLEPIEGTEYRYEFIRNFVPSINEDNTITITFKLEVEYE